MSIVEYLSEDCVKMNLKAATKKEALAELAALLARGGYISDRRRIVKDLLEREALGSTGIGRGIAFPHCRSSAAKTVRLALGLSRDGVPFQAMDGEPARMIVLEVAPRNARGEQLRIMGRLATLLMDRRLRERLLAAANPAEAVGILEGRGGMNP